MGLWFQVLFHSPSGVLFAFPSRYFCTIGRIKYLALDRGRPRFRQDSSCPAVLRYRPTESSLCRVRGFHPLCPAFPNRSAIMSFSNSAAFNAQTALLPHPATKVANGEWGVGSGEWGFPGDWGLGTGVVVLILSPSPYSLFPFF